MENISNDILLYKICYSDYEISVLFSLICKRFNNISKGYGNDLRTPKSFFLSFVKDVNVEGYRIEYWINKFTTKKEGKFIMYYTDGTKQAECYYRDDKLDGKHIAYYHDGNKMIECNYRDGNLHGKYECWYYTGNKREECNYKDGKLNGKCTKLYDNRNKKIKCNYDDDKLDGKYIEWYRNGNKCKEYNYKYGKRL